MDSRDHAVENNRDVLVPAIVDAALGDESTPIIAQSGSRRALRTASSATDAMRVSLDQPHAGVTNLGDGHDGGLLRRLSRQLNLLEVQQAQIRRLLDETERRASSQSRA